MCCICFRYFEKAGLEPVADEPGRWWDECKACWAAEEAMG